jgi:hypothetical protein
MSEIHINDIGTRFVINVQNNGQILDVSTSTRMLSIKKPDSSVISGSGTLVSDGLDGKIYYDSKAGDLDQAGYYKLQLTIGLASGSYHSNIHTFQVLNNI